MIFISIGINCIIDFLSRNVYVNSKLVIIFILIIHRMNAKLFQSNLYFD